MGRGSESHNHFGWRDRKNESLRSWVLHEVLENIAAELYVNCSHKSCTLASGSPSKLNSMGLLGMVFKVCHAGRNKMKAPYVIYPIVFYATLKCCKLKLVHLFYMIPELVHFTLFLFIVASREALVHQVNQAL